MQEKATSAYVNMMEISGANRDFTSIIICAVNHLQDLTIPCIRSVIQNTRENYELILIDDGSQDGTFQYFRSISRKAYRHESLRGVTKGRNLGLSVSEGNYICTLDNDVILPPGWLRILIGESKKDRVGIIGPMLTNQPRFHLPRSADGLIDVSEIAGACMLIKREVFNFLGYLDETFINCEDTDYCFRAILAGYRVVHTPNVLVYHKHFGTRGDLPQIRNRIGESRARIMQKYRGIFYK
jgi:O-antigen biosynthesis protein